MNICRPSLWTRKLFCLRMSIPRSPLWRPRGNFSGNDPACLCCRWTISPCRSLHRIPVVPVEQQLPPTGQSLCPPHPSWFPSRHSFPFWGTQHMGWAQSPPAWDACLSHPVRVLALCPGGPGRHELPSHAWGVPPCSCPSHASTCPSHAPPPPQPSPGPPFQPTATHQCASSLQLCPALWGDQDCPRDRQRSCTQLAQFIPWVSGHHWFRWVVSHNSFLESHLSQ